MSVGAELAKKAMWLYPKILGFNPSERWGHSACYAEGAIYVFGGCCGGLHFGDVLVLDLDTMGWKTLVTVGYGPGPRDSHSAVLARHRIIVFGGTNGCKKVNDLHVLDLKLKEWAQPECKGSPPSPRESHSCTLVGDAKLVIFGGSGEGEANYLNDLHILDLKTMRWTSPEVKGYVPVPRDSHSAIAIGSKLFVYGGDCGDRYHGDVDVLDLDTLTWSKLVIQGLIPGVRAGHASINIGTKVYVIGGVGDKHYYDDVWVLDVIDRSWTQLEICGQKPQGRFSHTAIIADSDIAIYGGCGEDERPLNELVVLQLGAEHPNRRYNISLCRILDNHLNQGKRIFTVDAENYTKRKSFATDGDVNRGAQVNLKQSSRMNSDSFHPKRRRSNVKVWETEYEQEEHSLSLSQNSSPSQSDQEQTPVRRKSKNTLTASNGFAMFKKRPQSLYSNQCNGSTKNYLHSQNTVERNSHDVHGQGGRIRQLKPDHPCHVLDAHKQELQQPLITQNPQDARLIQNMIGADIRGTVDAVFDSGYLMTAMVNGKLFRGVLFATGPGIIPRGPVQSPNPTAHAAIAQPRANSNHVFPTPVAQPQQLVPVSMPEPRKNFQKAQMPRSVGAAASFGREAGLRSDLQGVVLTLGGPGSGEQHK